MRVLMVSADYGARPFGGIGVHVNALTSALRSSGHHVDVIAPVEEGLPATPGNGADLLCSPFGPPGMDDDAELYPLGSPSLRDLQNSVGIIAASLDRSQVAYDVVHAHDFRVLNAAVALSQKYDCPLVATKHTVPARHWPPLTAAYARRVEAWGYPRCARLIAVSDTGLADLLAHADVSAEACSVIPNGSDLTLADGSLPEPNPMHRMLFVGRLQDTKGPDVAIRVLSHLPEPFHLVIAGEGPLRGELELLIEELGLAHRVELLGQVAREDMHETYLRAGLLLAPSRTEMGSIAIREAQGLGVPVAATAVGGTPEQLENGEAGLLLPVDDEERAAELVAAWCKDTDAVARARVRAWGRCSDLTWEMAAQRTVAEYLIAAGER